MTRHTITLGASTTAGGKVISASSSGSISGLKIALEGDSVLCPACRSTGKIRCVGPRVAEIWNGKQVALENDLCVCGCPTPPKLVPNQSLRFQTMNGSGTNEAAEQTPKAAFANRAADARFDDKFVLIDDETDEPLRNVEYAVERASGSIEFGVTDEHGRTHMLSQTSEPETVNFFI